jgi:hypothetical protein
MHFSLFFSAAIGEKVTAHSPGGSCFEQRKGLRAVAFSLGSKSFSRLSISKSRFPLSMNMDKIANEFGKYYSCRIADFRRKEHL